MQVLVFPRIFLNLPKLSMLFTSFSATCPRFHYMVDPPYDSPLTYGAHVLVYKIHMGNPTLIVALMAYRTIENCHCLYYAIIHNLPSEAFFSQESYITNWKEWRNIIFSYTSNELFLHKLKAFSILYDSSISFIILA